MMVDEERDVCQRCGVDWTGAPGHPRSYCDEMFIRMDHAKLIEERDKLLLQNGLREQHLAIALNAAHDFICNDPNTCGEFCRWREYCVTATDAMQKATDGFIEKPKSEGNPWAPNHDYPGKPIEKRSDICRVALPYGQSGVPDFCTMKKPCPVHADRGENYNDLAVETDKD